MGLRPIPRAGSSPHTRGTLFRRSRHILNRRFIPAYAGNAAATPRPRPARAVHPRIRGERPPGKTVYSFSIGSSPHTRGTPPGLQSSHPVWRFIPAYAGNASVVGPGCTPEPVHPRIRGERSRASRSSITRRGSSPHTRGTLPRAGSQVLRQRFIPAYAGNAASAQIPVTDVAVHPRIRGERTWAMYAFRALAGSSPHTRGTHVGHRLLRCHQRFIPAYAGNASTETISSRVATVHPRIRGERWHTSHWGFGAAGSSPHTRGTRCRRPCARGQYRFIPAYAGNAQPRRPTRPPVPVHPRIRGERSRAVRSLLTRPGSSPHTRGTPHLHVGRFVARRFIPAYAGNATNSDSISDTKSVHPRIRGERQPAPDHLAPQNGSSPHTRGTPVKLAKYLGIGRFIPAYAGNAQYREGRLGLSPVHPRIRGERLLLLSVM